MRARASSACAGGDMTGSGRADVLWAPEQVAVERGLAELRCGRPIIITAAAETAVVLPVDGMSDSALAAFRALSVPGFLLVTGRRARALGIEAAGPIGLLIGAL